jgi:hypothetical protein
MSLILALPIFIIALIAVSLPLILISNYIALKDYARSKINPEDKI